MFTTAQRDAALNLADSGHYLGFIKSITDLRAGTVAEADYTSYARVAISWDANAAHTSGRKQENSATLTGTTNTGSSQSLIAAGIWSASSAGTLVAVGGLGSNIPRVGYSNAVASETIFMAAHGYSADQRVFVYGIVGESLPAGLSEDVAYYVGTVPDANTFTLSTTAANANPVDITALGPVWVIPYTALSIGTDEFPQVAANALVFGV